MTHADRWARMKLVLARLDRRAGLITAAELRQIREKAAEVIGRERDQP